MRVSSVHSCLLFVSLIPLVEIVLSLFGIPCLSTSYRGVWGCLAACSDGTSRASDVDEPVAVNGSFVYYRGFRVLQATLAALLDRSTPPGPGMPSMATASRVLLSGSSAGGLTVYLHADWVADAVHAVAPAALVLAVPEVGFFIDGASSAFTPSI